MTDKDKWLLLDTNIQSVNNGLAEDGAELKFILMDKRMIRVGDSSYEFGVWDVLIFDLAFIMNNWDKFIQAYNDDGGDEEYGSLDGWGGSTSWIEQNCELVGSSSIKEK